MRLPTPLRSPRRLRPAFLALLVWVGLLVPGPVLGHAQLLSQDPDPGQILETAPEAVRVVFDEPIELGPNGLRVIDANGTVVDVGEETIDRVEVVQSVGDLADGWYLMTWGIVSEDGHIVQSASVFGVGDVAAADAPDAGAFSGSDGIDWILRSIGDLGTIMLGGVFAAWWLIRARSLHVARLAVATGVIAFTGTLAWLFLQLIDGGTAWLSTAVAWGTLARLISLVVAGVLAFRWPKPAGVAALVAVGSLAVGGHVTGSPIGTASQMAHLFAAMVWLGAAPAMLLTMRDDSVSDDSAIDVVRRFSRTATVAIVALLSAGTVLTIVLTDALAGGVTTWLSILAVKVALVLLAIVLGFFGRRHLAGDPQRARYRQLFAVDAGILLLVAMLSAALTLNPPEASHADHGTVEFDPRCTAQLAETSISIIADPGLKGVNELSVFGVPDGARSVAVSAAHEFNRDAPLSVELTADGDRWTADAVLPFRGAWEVTAQVRIDAFTEARGACTLGIAE